MEDFRSQNGFTILELSMVIVLIASLLGIALAYIPSAQMRSRDTERKSDSVAIKTFLEQQYIEKASSDYPTYASTTSLASTVSLIVNSGLKDSVISPGSNSASIVAATTNGDQSSIVTTASYIYQPFLPDGALCTTSSANFPCVRFKLWYKLEENSPPATYIESLRQQ